MKKKLRIKYALIAFCVLLVVIQFFRINRSASPVLPEKDFVTVTQMPEGLATTLKATCYDCHSKVTNYPWYTNIAPVSWWIGKHIRDGRKHLNFSEWGNYTSRKADHKLEECIEMLEAEEMPLASYLILHKEAKLSTVEKTGLINWFKSHRNFESESAEENETP